MVGGALGIRMVSPSDGRTVVPPGRSTDMSHDVTLIERSVEQTNRWLGELAADLEGGRGDAYRALRAVLHALRDHVNVDEAAQLGAQLPELIRGIYYAGWVPSRTPAAADAKAFLDRVAREALLAGDTEAAFTAAAVMRTLRRHVSAGELEDVLAQLPGDLRAVLAE
jgi:uncharacterized protein (DUF2267 family)